MSVNVVTIPSADRAFRAHVDAAIEDLGLKDLSALEARLREAYPTAALHVSSVLGSRVADDARLYVYRDRDAARQPQPGEWWRDEDLPRTVVNDEGRYLDANDAAARLFGVDRSTIVGSAAGRFTRHEGGEDVARRLFETVARYGEIASTAVVVRPNGEQVPIEFHMGRLASGTLYLTVMRPVGPLAASVAVNDVNATSL